jgi:long-chain acyl-CoA synthetase
MTELVERLRRIATQQPNALALQDPHRQLTWRQMIDEVDRLTELLLPYAQSVVALYADNSVDWACIDLACYEAGVISLPIPAFFSAEQQHHAISESGALALIESKGTTLFQSLKLFDQLHLSLTDNLILFPLVKKGHSQIPEKTQKITFTSGSTGQPKGVCLSTDNQLAVADAIIQRTELQAIKHLCVLPLTTLLENLAGIYAPLLSSGSVTLLPAAELGFNGGRGFDVQQFLQTLSKQQPESVVLLPELLLTLVSAAETGWSVPDSLKFIAVGGSRVSADLLRKADDLGLPVFEGYGLSECSSVVSLNSPKQRQIGSVGQCLDHVKVSIESGEIIVRGNCFLGYINHPDSWYPEQIDTGDLGFIDENRYLHINGRRKNLLISSFGRNINPEWVESELLANPILAYCTVIGDAKSHCSVLVQPRFDTITDAMIDQWIALVNKRLPDYAQLADWQRFEWPLSVENGTLTANGRPVRQQILESYHHQINALYKEQA